MSLLSITIYRERQRFRGKKGILVALQNLFRYNARIFFHAMVRVHLLTHCTDQKVSRRRLRREATLEVALRYTTS